MKIGDVVKLRWDGRIGLVTERFRRAESDGNPNGDFTVYYVHRVVFDDGTMMIRDHTAVEVINESR